MLLGVALHTGLLRLGEGSETAGRAFGIELAHCTASEFLVEKACCVPGW